jgi:hypothetical protein
VACGRSPGSTFSGRSRTPGTVLSNRCHRLGAALRRFSGREGRQKIKGRRAALGRLHGLSWWELQRSGHIHTLASNCHRQGHGGLRGIAMSEPIKSQSISRRRLFWLAAIAAAVAAPANMLSMSDARAQQSDQAPAAEPTAPKTGEKKKKKKTKATPGATTAPASSPPKTAPAPPKQQ